MKLTILGSYSATPHVDKSPTSQLLEIRGHRFLIDCGEGTQVRLRQHKIKFSQIKHIFISHIAGSERRYHTDCFKCYGCKTPIEPKTQQLCFSCDKKQEGSNSNQREKHPFHKQCYNTFFRWVCVVCGETLPTTSANDSNDGGRTKIEYLKHPFFDNEVRFNTMSQLFL